MSDNTTRAKAPALELALVKLERTGRMVRDGERLTQAGINNFDVRAAWLEYLDREGIMCMAVEYDRTDPPQRYFSDITAENVSGAKEQPTQHVREAARVGTIDEVSDPVLVEEAATGLAAVG